jgi:hypothetical protein
MNYQNLNDFSKFERIIFENILILLRVMSLKIMITRNLNWQTFIEPDSYNSVSYRQISLKSNCFFQLNAV